MEYWKAMFPDKQIAELRKDPQVMKKLLKVADQRQTHLKALELQAQRWKELGDRYDVFYDEMQALGEKLQKEPNLFMRVVNYLTDDVLVFRGIEIQQTLLPILGERVAQARRIEAELRSEIKETKEDTEKFERAVLIGELFTSVGPNDTPQVPRPEAMMQDRAANAWATREKIYKGTALALERAGQAMDEADKIAEHNARIGRWLVGLRLISAIAGFAETQAKDAPNNAADAAKLRANPPPAKIEVEGFGTWTREGWEWKAFWHDDQGNWGSQETKVKKLK